jgi:PAS domain S-box-containing protein
MSLLRQIIADIFRGAAFRSHHGAVTPLLLYLLLLVVVFTLDSLETWFTPHVFPFIQSFPRRYYDPFFTTLFIAPFLWWLVIRPIQKGAMDERIRYDAVKSQVVDAVVMIDLSGEIISFNPAAERIFGYSPEEISGRHAASLFCDTMLTAENLELLAADAGQSLPRIHQVTCHRKDGLPLNLEISVSRLLLAGKQQFLVIMRDITKRLSMEEEARQMQARLIQANKMSALGLMVSGVAHEVNNPNNYILSNAQLLERSCNDILKVLREYYRENGDFLIGGLPFADLEQHYPEMIAGIIGGSQRINSIVNDLKAFARQGEGEQFQQLDLNEAVKHAVSIVRNQIMQHTTDFTVALAESLPRINGNSQQVGQVVINLLMNACQSLPSNSCAITIRTFFDEKSAEAVIAVADEGEGVLPADCDRLIEPFFTTRRNSGGTGLGLSISHSIIKEHGGSITFETEPGRGTTFYVRIPVAELINRC